MACAADYPRRCAVGESRLAEKAAILRAAVAREARTIKEEEVDLSEYENFADALSQMGYFIEEVYQMKRIHSALGYLTPAEFEATWLQNQAQETMLKSQEKVSNFMGPLQATTRCATC